VIIGGDVGGTKTNLGLLERKDGALELLRLETYLSRDHRSLEEILAKFASRARGKITAAGLGVSGPVIDGRVRTTNLPWVVDGATLARQLGLPTVALLNDVEAQAWAVERLEARDVVTLQERVGAKGNVAVIAAGTGLGFSALIHATGATVSLASEGGHADFAPRTEIEVELLGELRARFGRVSIERVLSGPGLLNVYLFLRDTGRGEQPEWLAEAMQQDDASAAVAEAAIDGKCAICEQAVELFLRIYGAEAGNWALRTFATGGVYVGGGIAGKLLCGPAGTPKAWRSRARETFLRGFLDKGRLRARLEAMPLKVILNEDAPVLGAAHYAMKAAARQP
jgi:glucokinase